MSKIAVIIPALNEAGNIGPLVTNVLATLPADVIVVDNGSNDSTADEAKKSGARLISEPRQGYGYACAAGVRAADRSDILVFLDGDRSSHPGEIPLLISPIMRGEADLVLGSRVMGYIAPEAMPFQQKFGNWLAAHLMNILYELSVTDLGPFRAITRQLLIDLDMREMTYGWPTEMMVKAARKDARIKEVPVSFYPRQHGKSKVSGTLRGTVLATWYILGVTLRYAWGIKGITR